ncbi:MAG: tripartite tricarboxylate transporter permease, partial [Burkholderiaceae bacterium]
MIGQSLTDLWYGFGIAFEPQNLMWSIFGVVAGNLMGVLPGLGAMAAMSILLPLTYAMHPVPAILMLAGIFYGSMYGGAIGAILLNLPVHPPHAVACLDGYPLTVKGRGGAALGIAMIASFFAASVGILVMVFFSPLLVDVAFKFGPAELFSIMLLGLLAGSTMSKGSAVKGVAVTLFGLLIGVAGTDVNTGTMRLTFGMLGLEDGVNLVALAMGLFGIGEFLLHVNRMKTVGSGLKMRFRDMRPTKDEL